MQPEWAAGRAAGYADIGAVLPTRDGRRCGNAIVVSIAETEGGIPVFATIITDAGNTMKLSAAELEELFWPPVWKRAPGPLFRVRYMTSFGIPHVYCRLFQAPAPGLTFAGCGNFTLGKEDWAAFRYAARGVEFLMDSERSEVDLENGS